MIVMWLFFIDLYGKRRFEKQRLRLDIKHLSMYFNMSELLSIIFLFSSPSRIPSCLCPLQVYEKNSLSGTVCFRYVYNFFATTLIFIHYF